MQLTLPGYYRLVAKLLQDGPSTCTSICSTTPYFGNRYTPKQLYAALVKRDRAIDKEWTHYENFGGVRPVCDRLITKTKTDNGTLIHIQPLLAGFSVIAPREHTYEGENLS